MNCYSIFIMCLLAAIKMRENIYYKVVVLIHTSNPTVDQLKRYIGWGKNTPNNYYATILTDKCNIKVDHVHVSCMSPVIMMNTYPSIKNMSGNKCYKRTNSFYMWALPFEHIIIWINLNIARYKYLWVLEQDVSYSGNFFEFFKKYDDYNEDLVVISYDYLNNKWFWRDCFTDEYKKWTEKNIKYRKRLISPIHLTIWSFKLIKFMKKNMILFRHAYSESSLIECAFFNNLSIK